MPRNNNSNNCLTYGYDCSLSEEELQSALRAQLVVYRVLIPAVWPVAMLNNLIWLRALYLKAKSETAYWYQIFTVGSVIGEACAGGSGVLTVAFYGLAGAERHDQVSDLFRKCYFCMIYRANLALPLTYGSSIAYLLFSLCMAADRAYAVWRPLHYQLLNHTKLRLGALLVTLSVSVAVSVGDCFRWKVERWTPNPDDYQMLPNEAYWSGPAAPSLNAVRNSLRILALIHLLLCNGALLHFYRKRRLSVVQYVGTAGRAQLRAADRTLTALTISQSALCALLTVNLIISQATNYGSPRRVICGSVLKTPVADALFMLLGFSEFYALFAFSKPFRRMILVSLGRRVPVRPRVIAADHSGRDFSSGTGQHRS